MLIDWENKIAWMKDNPAEMYYTTEYSLIQPK